MTGFRIGSLCSGYGGLDDAVQQVFGGELAWFFEYDKAPSKILAHHWPDVPNYGDMTKADWTAIEQVDIICGGTPCQDLSAAGKRAGMAEGTRSNLWVQMREAIAIQRPSFVVWENVRGAYSAGADSEVEREEGLLGGAPGGSLRALGRVLGDLSDLGYDAEWTGVRAADVGAPHGRFRVFIIAYPHSRVDADTEGERRDGGQQSDGFVGAARRSRDTNRTTPLTDPGSDESERWGNGSNVGGATGSDTGAGEERERVRNTTSDSSTTAPDPDSPGCLQHGGGITTEPQQCSVEYPSNTLWGIYAPAIERWAVVLGRQAPAPTKADGKNGAHRLSAEFVEWMQGLDAGHVTSPVIGLTRNQQLKMLGNGCVPQQAAAAVRFLILRSKESTDV